MRPRPRRPRTAEFLSVIGLAGQGVAGPGLWGGCSPIRPVALPLESTEPAEPHVTPAGLLHAGSMARSESSREAGSPLKTWVGPVEIPGHESGCEHFRPPARLRPQD